MIMPSINHFRVLEIFWHTHIFIYLPSIKHLVQNKRGSNLAQFAPSWNEVSSVAWKLFGVNFNLLCMVVAKKVAVTTDKADKI